MVTISHRLVASSFSVHCFLLRTVSHSGVRKKPYSPCRSREVKLCGGMLTSNDSLSLMLKSLFLSFNRGVNTRPVSVINLKDCQK